MATESNTLTTAEIGLRCHDVHHGLANVDPRSAHLSKLKTTRIVGMAANLAVNIRGLDVIEDADALEQVAADELGVDPLVFGDVLELLQEAEMVSVRRTSGPAKIDERVPFHQNLYERLGEVWDEQASNDIERETVALTSALAHAPRELETIASEIPDKDLKTILTVGESTQLMKTLELSDGTKLVYSPFFIFENPTVLKDIFERHEIEEVRQVIAGLRGHQGQLVDFESPVLADMIARGLLMAPTIQGAGGDASFAFLPYAVDARYLGIERAVLDKAIAILACVRYGEERAVATRIADPALVLRKLANPANDFTVNPHSEHRRQYQTLYRLQIVDFIPAGNWVKVKLINTDDNRKAVALALDLLTHGEQVSDRGVNPDARVFLSKPGESYEHPVKTIAQRRSGARLDADSWADLASAMRGGTIL